MENCRIVCIQDIFRCNVGIFAVLVERNFSHVEVTRVGGTIPGESKSVDFGNLGLETCNLVLKGSQFKTKLGFKTVKPAYKALVTTKLGIKTVNLVWKGSQVNISQLFFERCNTFFKSVILGFKIGNPGAKVSHACTLGDQTEDVFALR